MKLRPPVLTTACTAALLRIVVIGASIGLIALPATAAAGTSPADQSAAGVPARGAQSPDNFSSGDQYVETIPSTKGPRVVDDKHHKAVKLPAGIEQRLRQGGPDSDKLLQIATSTELGAPDQKLPKERRANQRSRPGVPSAAIDAVGGGHSGIDLLAIWLLVITALALGTVGYRRYKNRNASD
jgi:hypothetical protein